ncbi:MAG TPA: hypothetical protein VML50_05460 [Anaeromyxobacter sp.]|nr:hypothetical protein [Anaeromyxobacter sp.]
MEGKPIGDEEAPGTRVEPAVEAPAAAPGSAVGRGLLPDGVKKALLAGVGALFMTEEGARRLAREWKLPKEVIGFVGQQAQGAKDEILRVLSDEVRRFLESEALHREFWKALSGMAIEVKAEIRLLPGEDGRPRPEVKATVRPRRARRKAKG